MRRLGGVGRRCVEIVRGFTDQTSIASISREHAFASLGRKRRLAKGFGEDHPISQRLSCGASGMLLVRHLARCT
jgi:hypothetical protein